MRFPSALADSALDVLTRFGLLSDYERSQVTELFSADGRFVHQLNLAETLHLHIKVDDTDMLPERALFAAGADLDHCKGGYVKYRLPGQINAIFSHIKISQDDLLETESSRRSRPFLDHIGIDLRQETEVVRTAFEGLANLAQVAGWPLVSQGGEGKRVYCCHTQVLQKRWLYPSGSPERPGIPLEFAYGPLAVNSGESGCDLRPADPRRAVPVAIPCCAPSQHECS